MNPFNSGYHTKKSLDSSPFMPSVERKREGKKYQNKVN